jgi:hypothetical protein
METGQRGASARDVRDLCDLYGVDVARRRHLTALAREGKDQAWWQPFDLPYATYVGLEAAAISISDYEPGVFPALLQTPGYARAIHEGAMPRLSPAVIDQRIESRRLRQEVLVREDDPPRLAAVIDEAVLHRPVGGPAIMRAQLDRVIQASALPHVTVQVLPYRVGAHPALNSTFVVLEFRPPVPGVVYVDGLVGQIYLERPQEVLRYKQVFDQLRAMSLDPQDSTDLMARASSMYADN